MQVEFEYGNGLMKAELPDTTDVFIPGETIRDPPWLHWRGSPLHEERKL